MSKWATTVSFISPIAFGCWLLILVSCLLGTNENYQLFHNDDDFSHKNERHALHNPDSTETYTAGITFNFSFPLENKATAEVLWLPISLEPSE